MKVIGLELQGKMTVKDDLTTYYMTEEEIKKMNNGEIAVVGTVTYEYGPNGSSKTHKNTIVNMNLVKEIDIFYDIEDDNMMSQTLLLKDGSTIFGKSRNHEEVSKWEARGIKINKSYGY